jgi:hypothetical protein
MKLREKTKKILIGISIVILSGLGNAAAQTRISPETIVANLYKGAKAREIAAMSKTELRKYFDKELADLIWKTANSDNGLDFDILYDAQDTQIRNFRIGKAENQSPSLATVDVSFTNFGEKKEIQFLLASYGAEGWKITDIYYNQGILSKILNGEFK